MSDEPKPSRLRAIFKNAVVWAVGWGAAGTAVASIMRLFDGIGPLNALLDGIGMGVRIGIAGGIVGAVFAAFISVIYRDKKLSEINWLKFGIGGAVFCGLFLPAFLQTMNLLSGSGFVAWSEINGDALMAAVFGGIIAAGTMKLAQYDAAKNPVTAQDMLSRMEQQSLAAGETLDSRISERMTQKERG
jgi:hypothetical protein